MEVTKFSNRGFNNKQGGLINDIHRLVDNEEIISRNRGL